MRLLPGPFLKFVSQPSGSWSTSRASGHDAKDEATRGPPPWGTRIVSAAVQQENVCNCARAEAAGIPCSWNEQGIAQAAALENLEAIQMAT